MHTTIFYFSATGNSLSAARALAAKLTNTSCVSIPMVAHKPIRVTSEKIGLVFPVYAWGLPHIVTEFIKKLELSKVKYCFVAATCGSSVGGTFYQAKKLLAEKGIVLNSGFKVVMPGNYTPLYGSGPDESIKKILVDAEKNYRIRGRNHKKFTGNKNKKRFSLFYFIRFFVYCFFKKSEVIG